VLAHCVKVFSALRRYSVQLLILFAACAASMVLQLVKVSGESMRPTFCSNKLALALSSWASPRGLQRNDIVIFKYPTGHMAFKRVVGIEGDVVRIQSGRTYISGKPVDEPFHCEASSDAFETWPLTSTRDNPIGVVVKEKTVFVLGDNRAYSDDSRTIGLVPVEQVVARVLFALPSVGHGCSCDSH
jgi:signal peptidase I